MERTERAGGGEPGEGGREWITENIENINNSSEKKQFIASFHSTNKQGKKLNLKSTTIY